MSRLVVWSRRFLAHFLTRSLHRAVRLLLLLGLLWTWLPPAPAQAGTVTVLPEDGQEVRPQPWSEMWAVHPLNNRASTVSYALPASEDTYLSARRPKEGLGGLSYGEIGSEANGLIKFNLQELPKEGTLPISQLHLAIALTDNVPYSSWLGLTAACRAWQETSANWDSANCPTNETAIGTFPSNEPNWLFIELTDGIGLSETGYFIFATSAGPTRRFLTREAGEEWAPRLVVTYARDTQVPTLTGWAGTDGPQGTLLWPEGWNLDVTMNDDTGLGRLIVERQMKSTGSVESAVIVQGDGCYTWKHENQLYDDFPFADRPLGKEFLYRVWLEDCTGKRSEPLVFDRIIHVKRVEQALLYDFAGEPLPAGEVMRRDDRQIPELLPASVQYGYGQTDYFGSISDVPEYWVDAPGFPAGSDHVLAGESINSSPAQGIKLYVPWHGSQRVAAGQTIQSGTPWKVPVRLPVGSQVRLGTVARTLKEESEGDIFVGNVLLGVETPSGDVNYLTSDHVSSAKSFLSADLSLWAGQQVTVTVSLVPQADGTDWSAQLSELVVAPRNPELSVQERTTVARFDDFRAGVPTPITYQVEIVRAAKPTTLTLDAPTAVQLTDFSLQPTRQVTETDRLRYEWVMSKVQEGSHVITATASLSAPGGYDLELAIANERDPYLANNQARIRLIGSEHIVYLPTVSAR